MVDPLGLYTITVTFILVAGIFIGYLWTDDFTGIMLGIAAATAVNYLMRSLILGFLSGGG